MRGADEMEDKAGFGRPVRKFTLFAWATVFLGLQLAGGISLFIHLDKVCK